MPENLSFHSYFRTYPGADGLPQSVCVPDRRRGAPRAEPRTRTGATPDYAWTDIAYLLHRAHVPWRYYVFKGSQPDCSDGAMFCTQIKQNATTPGIWNPLPWFDTVKQDGQRENVAPFEDFLTAARSGT